VNLGIVKFLGFEQIFKNALTGMPIGGGKGGSDFDPKGRSDAEIMRFCQSFMSELYRHLGEYTYVPAGDIGVGAREIGYLFGQYKRITNRYESGVLTGKGLGWGGALVRTEATGYGAAFFAQAMMEAGGDALDGKRVVISGSGNVAVYGVEKVHQLGGAVVAVSDSGGYVVDEKGIDLDVLKQVKEVERGRIGEYADRVGRRRPSSGTAASGTCRATSRSRARPRTSSTATPPACSPATAAATSSRARTCPRRPTPSTSSREAGIAFAPGKAANAGGVATSALEMQQNASRDRWNFAHSEAKLEEIMRGIHRRCHETAEEYGSPGDLVLGANVAGFLEVAEAVHAHGLI
jgi:glutamate dehydrogenase (NADP+)